MSQLKEINGRYYQEAEVVMVSTKNDSNIYLKPQDSKLVMVIEPRAKQYAESLNFPKQHLYILSNEEIKEGDWYCSLAGIVSQHNGTEVLPEGWKKIIATTNESLHIPFVTPGNEELEVYEYTILPKPSDSFIKKYIEEYNASRTILKVLVEYEEVYPKHFTYNPSENIIINLKVDSNNTINIKKVEVKLYTIEEIFNALDESIKECILYADFNGQYHSSYDIQYSKKLLEQKLNNN